MRDLSSTSSLALRRQVETGRKRRITWRDPVTKPCMGASGACKRVLTYANTHILDIAHSSYAQ